jgi:hypothetical protein
VLLLQDDYTALVKADEAERVLAEVDPERGDDSSGLVALSSIPQTRRGLRFYYDLYELF